MRNRTTTQVHSPHPGLQVGRFGQRAIDAREINQGVLRTASVSLMDFTLWSSALQSPPHVFGDFRTASLLNSARQ